MRYILNSPKQEKFCDILIEAEPEEEDIEINSLIDGCKSYYFKVYGNSYFLSKTMDKRIKHGRLQPGYLESIYD